MSQKSYVPQAISFVSQVLKRDTAVRYGGPTAEEKVTGLVGVPVVHEQGTHQRAKRLCRAIPFRTPGLSIHL